MRPFLLAVCCSLCFTPSPLAGQSSRIADDVVAPLVPDALSRVTLNQQELAGELDRRIESLIRNNYMAIDLDAHWLDHFRTRTERGDRQYVYYGIGKVFDAGSLFAAYTGDTEVAARTQYIVDELVKARDTDGYIGFWSVEPGHRQNHINWILHEQEYINLGFVRHYRCMGDAHSLAHARIMGDHILNTFPTPQNPCYDPGAICTAGLPEGMLELYRATGDTRYLAFAADVPHGNNRGEIQLASLRTWDQDFSRRPCHVYVMLARCYAQTELYRLTGEKQLLNMSQFMRNELLKEGAGGMLVTGSCSEGEHFTYNQNGRGDIGESCVTAYMLRWIDSLMRLEGDMRYGDLMERTVYNALFAANSPDGRHIRYFTPFSGERAYDTRDSFCCCGNYRRAIAELPQKVYYRTPDDGIALNLFTSSCKSFDVQGECVTILQETEYPNSGDVRLTFSTAQPVPFAFQFRTPRWCDQITVRVNDAPPVTIDPRREPRGCHVLHRTWQDGDVVTLAMPMAWRMLRGRATQEGRVVLVRGPVVYCIGAAQNTELLAQCPEPANLVVDPASITAPTADDSIRPQGLKTTAKAWLHPDCSGQQVDIVLTEFIDPSGREIYFRVPNLNDTSPIRLSDDELISWPNEFVNAHLVKAFYGPQAAHGLEAIFEVRGDVAADLAANYVRPGGQTGVPADFPDSANGNWSAYNCGNGGLLSTANPGDALLLNSQFKAFGSPVGYAYGLEHQGDELGFLADYAPSDRQEEAWRNHYTEKTFDRVLSVAERSEFLYTHPIADTARYSVFRWTPSAEVRGQAVTLCGTVLSNLGNGVQLRVIRWNDNTRHDVLGTFNTADLVAGQHGTAEFVLRLAPGEVGKHLDFVLHNGGSHICDATALRVRALTNVRQDANQIDVTEQVQPLFRRRLITPLGTYSRLFGDVTPGTEKTLKVKLHFWRDGTVRYLELPPDAPLDLTKL